MDGLGAMAVCQVEECDRGWLRMLFSALVWVSLRGVLTWYSIPTSRISALWRFRSGLRSASLLCLIGVNAWR